MAAPINAQILQSLQSFTQSLRQENVRLDEEERKDRVRTSASRISEAFSTLQPGHDEEDARQLMLDVIGDAADLEALDANLPLIQGLYSDSLNAIRTFKEKKQDKYLQDYVTAQDPDDKIPDEMLGVNQMKLLQHQQGRETQEEVFGDEGRLYANTFDAEGNVTREILKDPRTFGQRQQATVNLERAKYLARPRSSFRIPTGAIGANGELLIFDQLTGITYSQVIGDNGQPILIPYEGVPQTKLGSHLTETEQKGIVRDIKTQKDLSKSLYVDANAQAKILAEGLGISPVNKEGKVDAFTKISAMTSQEIYAKIREVDDPVLKQNMADTYGLFVDRRDDLTQANDKISRGQLNIDYQSMKEKTGLDDQQYTYWYDEAEDHIMQDTKAAEWLRHLIEVYYKGQHKGQLAVSVDDPNQSYLEAWRQLNVIDKGRIMKKMKEIDTN